MRRRSSRTAAPFDQHMDPHPSLISSRKTGSRPVKASGRAGSWPRTMWLSLISVMLLLQSVEGHDISQISPKSSSDMNMELSPLLSTARLTLEPTMIDSPSQTSGPQQHQQQQHSQSHPDLSADNETPEHVRVERSALPILNENFPKGGANSVHFPGGGDKGAGSAGRYFQYNIKPTGTYDALSENPETTQRVRTGKTINTATSAASTTGSFLADGDLRQPTSGSPISPTSSTATSTAATATALPPNGRQNPNPDIQDIITGIVKLLNGNVNVHANTQGHRRPTASRINNRGPPRISDVPTLPIEYDGHKHGPGASKRPPPYSFDRPDRPFITGVPLPEQIVPYRPGFVSSRPPWHRNKPRPPISTTSIGGRRPIPQYKPIPASQLHPPQIEATKLSPPVAQSSRPAAQSTINSESSISMDLNGTVSAPRPTDPAYDSEFSNEDLDTQYIEVSDNDSTATGPDGQMEPIKEETSATLVKKEKEGSSAKKKPNKPKTQDKKKHPTEPYTTIIETSSVVHTVMHMSSTYVPMPMNSADSAGIDPSTEEVIFMTASKTPELESSVVEPPAVGPSSTTATSSSSSAITTSPLSVGEAEQSSVSRRTDLPSATIEPTSAIPAPLPSTTTTTSSTSTTSTTSTTTTTTTTTTEQAPTNASPESVPPPPPPSSPPPPPSSAPPPPPSSAATPPSSPAAPPPLPSLPPPPPHPPQPSQPSQYHPRPGIVLDDPEFKPGGRPRPQARPSQPAQHPHQPPRGPPLAQPHPRPPLLVQPTRQHLPPGYGEIFDVTLSAIQGPGSLGGSQQTINIKPYGSYGSGGSKIQHSDDIIVSAAGDDGFVSIDGKRTYINLFGEPTEPPAGALLPSTPATAIPQLPGFSDSVDVAGGGSGGNGGGGDGAGNAGGDAAVTPQSAPLPGYGLPETEVVELQPTKPQSPPKAVAVHPHSHSPPTTNSSPARPHYRPRTTQPPVRIDTCIVGDDSTCDQAQNERCRTENGVSSCHCRPGYSRRKHREPCRKVISFYLGMRVDRIYEHRIVWDNKLADRSSEPFSQLSYESLRAIDSAMSMTPYSDEFMAAKVNNIYRGDPGLGGSGVYVNLTIKLDESVETLRPNLRSDVQKHLLGVLHRRNNNIGNSVLYVSTPEGAISALRDLDECQSRDLNDCHVSASCSNLWGSFRCVCPAGTRDPWADQPARAGRECQSCPDTYCNARGTCSYNEDGNQACVCDSGYYGGQCEIDGEVLGVAIGASIAAVVIIVLTLICLIMWSRRWQREQKNAIGSPVFGYMNTAPLKAAALPQSGYQVTLEDRMRWAQIADVMAQTNHYGVEPIGGPTRPSSAMFAYPNLPSLGMGTIGGLSMQSTIQHVHQNPNMAPPVPMPRRVGLNSRSSGMATLENSSSSEEEDRTDLLGRNFQVPRPKSRSNGSIANQSGIYYDVDYEPSGNGVGNTSVDRLYGSHTQNQSTSHSHVSNNHIPGPQGIPMSTYTSGRAPSSYYMK